MGWTSIRGKCKDNGKVAVKSSIDHLLNDDTNTVLRSSMIGSTYYAAVKTGNDVWAAVFLTSTSNKNYFNLSYKDMDETCGPRCFDCPTKILDLLTPTTNKTANEWRRLCKINQDLKKKKKKDPNALSNLPDKSVIEFSLPYDTPVAKKGTTVQLTKNVIKNKDRTSTMWTGFGYRWSRNLIPDNYTVLP